MIDLQTFEGTLAAFLSSTLCWTILWILVNKFVSVNPRFSKKEALDIKNRYVSILNGLIDFLLNGYFIYTESPSYTASSTAAQNFVVLSTGGYFLYDWIACWYYDIIDFDLHLHHSISVILYFASSYYQYSTCLLSKLMKFFFKKIVGLFLAEAPNLPLHLRAIYRLYGKKNTKIYELIETVYIGVFMLCRGVISTAILPHPMILPEIPLLMKVFAIVIWLQALLFIKRMVSILRRKVSQYKERCEKGIELNWFDVNPEVEKLSYIKDNKKDKIF